MPVYQYKCTDCKTEKDVVRGINDNAPDPVCNNCSNKMRRRYSSIGITFNGSGFYSKDK